MGSTYSFGLLFLADWAQRAEQSNRIAPRRTSRRAQRAISQQQAQRPERL